MRNIKFDCNEEISFIKENEIHSLENEAKHAHDILHSGAGAGGNYTGWLDLPLNYDRNELERLKDISQKIIKESDIFIVIGIGGSYLGARACIEALTPCFNNDSLSKTKTPKVYFAGNNISAKYLLDIFDLIGEKDVSINVISKSGTTTEPAIAFRFFKNYLEKRYGKDGASKRIYVTTDKEKGALKRLAKEKNYESFVIPDDIGGRFSVLTPVGLLPVSVCGIDIDEMLRGAQNAHEEYKRFDLLDNDCYRYAVIRNILYKKNKTVEMLVNYEPSHLYLAEWWKQLFGESEGKENKGLLPASLLYTTDLHSLGQYVQEGLRNIFETVINIQKPVKGLIIEKDETNVDGLNYVAGKDMNYVNQKAMEGTVKAHVDGGVPNLMINVPQMDAYNLGNLIYFFEKACAISGYILGVNPFNQPGVEEYKKNMFKLLGRPGYN